MDLRRSDLEGLNRLAAIWKTTPGAEFEAMLTGLDLTGWQDVIQYLRSLGMRENPQLVKMNICLSNDIRITLEGAGVIQAYCRDNRISDKPFVAMLKEAITDAEPVTLGAYGAKAKLKREIPLAADDARVKEALSRWDQLGKHFRNIQRFEFVAPGGIPIRFDVSIVRENAGKPARTFQEARVTTQLPKYEVEVELTAARSITPDKAAQNIVRGLSWLLQGRQRSFVLVSNQAADYVRDSIGAIFGPGRGSNRNGGNRGRPAFKYPGPQPATLERKNIVEAAEPGIPNMRTMPGGYNVTDKADGLRCLLFVSDNGRVFLIDGGARVYATGKQVEPSIAGLVLDGEWIRRNRKGVTVSHYYAFDILAAKGGDTSVTGLPFMIAGAMLGSSTAANTRQAVMASFVGILGSATQAVRGVPASDNLQIGMKAFRASLGADIFQAGAAATLEDAKSAPYNTDGLIFTPNSAPLPLGRGTWPEQLKWKPPHENTIDFLVIVDRERDAKGQPLAAEAIGTKYREDSGQTVRYKTLRLFVGSNRDGAFADPRMTVLSDGPLPRSLDEGEWREVEFRPVDPRDPMASLCYVAIDAGSADPAGATAAATALDAGGDLIRTTRTGDVIQSDMIVEMAYHPERAPGWRWEPTRVRHDKTERFAKQAQQGGSGRKGGTMNADWVANSIWNSLHNPVDEDAIRSGRVSNCNSPVALSAPGAGRRTNGRDQMVVQCMRNFHDYVKRSTLLRKSVMPSGSTVCDLAMSNGCDLGKWVAADVSFVFGCDVQASAINSPDDGAYRRLLDKMVELGGRDRVPVMAFAQADAARRLITGEAAMTPDDVEVMRGAIGPGGPAPNGFDLVSCMFALHYMFRDEATLTGFLTNLADLVKVGGYFVGCGKDGDAVARTMAGQEQSVVGGNAWMMTKRYGAGIGTSVPPSAAGIGLAVDVDNIAAGETVTEYLVSWPYLQARLAECGLELLNAEETATLGLPASTQMFAETWATAEAGGNVFTMTDAIKRLSFLNRWFIFKRRSDRRPAPLAAGDSIAPPAVTEALPATEAPAPADVIEMEPAAADVIEMGPAPADVIEMEPAVAEPLLINAANKKPDQRLGAELADWPRYMTLGIQMEIADLTDPTIKYPSVEAAIAAAKYQKATDKPELGASLFRVEGAIHQKFAKEREKLTATGAPEEALTKSVDDEVAMVRIASGKAKMKAYKATWNEEVWADQRAEIYQAYLAQRFATDARFRVMIETAKKSGAELMFVNGVDPSYLGVGVRIDGSIAGGENMIGKWMQKLAQ